MDTNTAARIALLGFVSTLVPLVAGPFAHAADVARGRSLAQVLCSQCHFITTNQKGWFDAPSFVAIANNPATTSTSWKSSSSHRTRKWRPVHYAAHQMLLIFLPTSSH